MKIAGVEAAEEEGVGAAADKRRGRNDARGPGRMGS